MKKIIFTCSLLLIFITATFSQSTQWKVWKTIKVGTGINSSNQFLNALHQKGFVIPRYDSIRTYPVLDSVKFSKTESSINLVLVPRDQFKGVDHQKFDDLLAKAKSLGLKPCPAEVALQLRLQYTNQPKDESFFVAMEPISLHDKYSKFNNYIFYLNGKICGGNGKPGLTTSDLGYGWYYNDVKFFVFCVTK